MNRKTTAPPQAAVGMRCGGSRLAMLAALALAALAPWRTATAQDAGILQRQHGAAAAPAQAPSGDTVYINNSAAAAAAGAVMLADIRLKTMGADGRYDQPYELPGWREFVAAKAGRVLAPDDLQQLSDEISALLRRQGRTHDFAWLPQQQIVDGVVTINIFVGNPANPPLVVTEVASPPPVMKVDATGGEAAADPGEGEGEGMGAGPVRRRHAAAAPPQEKTSAEPGRDEAAAKPAQTLLRVRDMRLVAMASDQSISSEPVSLPGMEDFVADNKGRAYSSQGLQGLADAVTDMLHDQGRMLDYAWLPPQDIVDGVLTIAVFQGEMDDPPLVIEHVGAPTRLSEEKILDHVDIKAGDRLQQQELEEKLLLTNDLPGVVMGATLGAGDAPGKSRLLLKASGEPPLVGVVGVNSHGSSNVGQHQALANLRLNSPLRLGDSLDMALVLSKGLRYAAAEWALPLGASGTRASIAASQLNYKHIEGIGRTAGFAGDAQRLGLGLSQPLIRSRRQNMNLNLALWSNQLNDDAAAGNMRKRQINGLTIGFDSQLADAVGGGYTISSMAYDSGQVDLSGNAQDEAADRNGYRTAGRFGKLTTSLERLQPLGDQLSLLMRLRSQQATSNLDTSQQFSLGGPNGVRAYTVTEASGDSGWLTTLEARWRLPEIDWLGRPQVFGFIDSGGVALHHDPRGLPIATASGANNYRLSAWGVGLNLVKPGRYQFNLTWARKIGDNPGRNLRGRDVDGMRHKWRLSSTLTAPL